MFIKSIYLKPTILLAFIINQYTSKQWSLKNLIRSFSCKQSNKI